MGRAAPPARVRASAAAAGPAATAAAGSATERRLRGRTVNGERRELLQHIRRIARRTGHHLVVAPDELVEMILALHARVLVDRHESSVLSATRGALDDTDAGGPRGAARTARAGPCRRPLGRLARPASLAVAADRPAIDARRVGRLDGRCPGARRVRARPRIRDRARSHGNGRRVDALPRVAAGAPEPRNRVDVADTVGLGQRCRTPRRSCCSWSTHSTSSAAGGSSSRRMPSTSEPAGRSRPPGPFRGNPPQAHGGAGRREPRFRLVQHRGRRVAGRPQGVAQPPRLTSDLTRRRAARAARRVGPSRGAPRLLRASPTELPPPADLQPATPRSRRSRRRLPHARAGGAWLPRGWTTSRAHR